MRRRQRPERGSGDEAGGPALCESCVSNRWRKSGAKGRPGWTTRYEKEQRCDGPRRWTAGHKGNQWIKSGSRIDLEGMRRRQHPGRSRSAPSERPLSAAPRQAADPGRQIAEGRSVAALSAAPMYRADLERSKTGDRDQRISVRRECEGTQRPWAPLEGSVQSLRLRSDEIRSSTSNGVYRSAEIKLSATISPPERTKGIEPIASHVLARPIIVSYALLLVSVSVHWKFSKFLLTTTSEDGSFESNRVGGATRPRCRRRLRAEGVAGKPAAFTAPAWARAARAIGRQICLSVLTYRQRQMQKPRQSRFLAKTARASARHDLAKPGLTGVIARAMTGLRPSFARAEPGRSRGKASVMPGLDCPASQFCSDPHPFAWGSRGGYPPPPFPSRRDAPSVSASSGGAGSPSLT
jgi:hypothetical protein